MCWLPLKWLILCQNETQRSYLGLPLLPYWGFYPYSQSLYGRTRYAHADVITKFSGMDRLPNCLSNGTPLVSRFLVLVDLRLKCSLSSGIICGSLSQRCCRLSANRVVSRPRTPSCFWATKSQDEAWLTEKANPQVQLLGRSSKGRL